MSENDAKIAVLENEKRALYQQWLAADNQRKSTLNDADKPVLQKQMEGFESQIQEVEDRIRELRLQQSSGSDLHIYREYSQVWEEKLPQLNFTESKKIIKNIFDRFENQKEEQALFLLQKKDTMRGDLCIQHIKALLQSMDMGDWYPPFEYTFPRHQPLNQVALLSALANRFGVDSPSNNVQYYTSSILEKICKSFTGGNVFLLYIELSVATGDSFLEWFVFDFWQALITQLDLHRNNHPFIKVIGIIATRNLIPRTCLSTELCCTKQKFDGKKILELPLKNWSEKEIHDWLWKHSKLSGLGYERTHMKTMAETIYADSDNGKPSEACNQLWEALKQSLNEKRVS